MADIKILEAGLQLYDPRFTKFPEKRKIFKVGKKTAKLLVLKAATLPESEHWYETAYDESGNSGADYTPTNLRTLRKHNIRFLNNDHDRLPMNHPVAGDMSMNPTTDGVFTFVENEGDVDLAVFKLDCSAHELLEATESALIKLGEPLIEENEGDIEHVTLANPLDHSDALVTWV